MVFTFWSWGHEHRVTKASWVVELPSLGVVLSSASQTFLIIT